jgi:uncharacterized membrane protein YgaE (UPF0421/DUF939 family)
MIPLNSEPEKGTRTASIQVAVAVVVSLVAWLFAPDLGSFRQHSAFADFFATCAQVIAALMIALAIEAQVVVRRLHLAVVTAASVAIGEVAAIAALSPMLPPWSYRWLFAVTIGGGVGALVAVLMASVQALGARIDERHHTELKGLAERFGQEAARSRDKPDG